MAGDWVAACKDLPDKPEVIALANAVRKSRYEVAGFLVFRFWAWADGQTADGSLPNCRVDNLVEMFMQPPIFWDTLQSVGWLSVSTHGLVIPNFHRWMGKSAKNRLSKSARQARWRSPGEQSVDAAASTDAPTTEPKRTEPNHQGVKPPETPIACSDRSKATTARKPRERDELFDTLAEITASDPATNGSLLGRACKELRSADPPYTAAELLRFVDLAPEELPWLTGRITVGLVKKYIGIVRAKPRAATAAGPKLSGKEGVVDMMKRLRRERGQ